MRTIREYPASLEEELQIRFVRIIIALALLLLGLFVLAFFAIPFPLLVAAFFGVGAVLSVAIWRHRLAPDEDIRT